MTRVRNSHSNVPHLPTFLKLLPNRYVFFLTFSRDFQKLSVIFLKHFWLQNVLRATTACIFLTLVSQVFREGCVLHILTSKLVSRHNGVDLFDIWTSKSAPRPSVWQHLTSKFVSRHSGLQFFISHLPRWLRTRRFNELSFRPSGATNHSKNVLIRDWPTFLRMFTFFLLMLSVLWSSCVFSSLFWLFPPLRCH